MRDGLVWLDPRLDLPAWLFAGIGRVTAEWAYLEWTLEECIRILHQTDVKRGRIAAAGMNARTRALSICGLLQAHKLDSIAAQFTKAWDKHSKLQTERDTLAHGLWSKFNGAWFVIRTSSSRDVPPLVGKITRAALPERYPVTRPSLSALRKKIREARKDIEAFQRKLEAELPPSPYKSPRQLSRHYRHLARTKQAQ